MMIDELFSATPEELSLLKAALELRRRSNVFTVGGRPFIHGVPAEKTDSPDKFGIGSDWLCPFCKCRLADDSFICLNTCHLTAPQHQEFQMKAKAAFAKVEAKRHLINSVDWTLNKDNPNYLNSYADLPDVLIKVKFKDKVEKGMFDYRREAVDWIHDQNLTNKFGFTKIFDSDFSGIFTNEDDAMLFKIKYGE